MTLNAPINIDLVICVVFTTRTKRRDYYDVCTFIIPTEQKRGCTFLKVTHMPEYELIYVNGLQLVSIKWNAAAWFLQRKKSISD